MLESEKSVTVPSFHTQRTVQFELLHPDELAQVIAETPVAYVPCGSLEWHGRHLPLGCDAMRGQKECVEAAKRTGGVVLPAHYIAAPGYCAYGGSIVFTPATVIRSPTAKALTAVSVTTSPV